MRISEASWIKYIGKLRQINNEAADKMAAYLYEHEFTSVAGRRAALDYAFALSTRYGEAATALACEMYDAVSAASGVAVLAAEPAETATYAEVAKTVNGAFKQTESPDVVSQAVGRLVKRAGVDTTMKNAIRDGAEWAWIPHGDTCAFCITLASRGWQKASRAALKGNHAEHIHSNCDCTYAIRFGRDTTYAGYDPDKYLEAYENADGSKPQDKINALRRQHYAENKDRINEQKRIAYAKRKQVGRLAEMGSQTALQNIEKIREVESTGSLAEVMKSITGKPVDLSGLDLDLMKTNMEQINSLGQEYGFRFSEIVSTNKRAALGEVVRTGARGQTVTLQYPKKYYGSRDDLLRELRKTASDGSMPRIPGRYIDVYTSTHEFAHTLTEQLTASLYGYGKELDFWGEIDEIYLDYKKTGGGVLGKYAASNQNEFFAEAFASAKLAPGASEHAGKVLEVVDRYFRRKP